MESTSEYHQRRRVVKKRPSKGGRWRIQMRNKKKDLNILDKRETARKERMP